MSKRIVFLSGSSGVGKGPLVSALKRLFSWLVYGGIVLYTSRKPRKGEIDGIHYHFNSYDEIESFDRERFIVRRVRSDLQGIDTKELELVLEGHNVVFIEAYPPLAAAVADWATTRYPDSSVEVIRCAMVPATDEELQQTSKQEQCTPRTVLEQLMKAKLENRSKVLGLNDSNKTLKERASAAFDDANLMVGYEHTLACRRAEDDINAWNGTLHPECKRLVEELAALIDPLCRWVTVDYCQDFSDSKVAIGSDRDCPITTVTLFGTAKHCKEQMQRRADSLSVNRKVDPCPTETEQLVLQQWKGYREG